MATAPGSRSRAWLWWYAYRDPSLVGRNSAWLEIARLAWNLGKWIVQLVLPDEVVRWEWKRSRQTFVYAAAQIVCSCRQVIIQISAAHR